MEQASKEPERPKQAPNMAEILADYDKTIAFFSQTPAEAWEQIQPKTALRVFETAYNDTDAYKKFLKSQKTNIKKIDTIEKFSELPIMDKDNYVKKYGFENINTVTPGKDLYSFSMSSGTAGKPTIWPRYFAQEEGYVRIFETIMRLYWNIDKKKTLAINAYNLGVYASGIAVNVALRPLTQKFPLTVATTGSDLDNIVETAKQLSPYYDQTIIFSYPTFVRTVLDKLEEAKVDLKKINLKVFIGGEGNTVEWNKYVNKIVTGNEESLTTILDGYGTTDLGLLAMGTALTNLIRILANNDKELCFDLFNDSDIVPTLFQYFTNNYYIEQIGNEMIFTSSSATPLVRYNLHDRGGVIKFRDMVTLLNKHGYDFYKILSKHGLKPDIIWQLPFVYCYGRRDDVVIVGGGNVFPEQITPVLTDDKLCLIHSLKLAMYPDKEQHQIMNILLELKSSEISQNIDIELLEKKYHKIILKQLLKVNSDFAVAYRSDPIYCSPVIKIYNYAEGPFAEDHQRTKPKLLI